MKKINDLEKLSSASGDITGKSLWDALNTKEDRERCQEWFVLCATSTMDRDPKRLAEFDFWTKLLTEIDPEETSWENIYYHSWACGFEIIAIAPEGPAYEAIQNYEYKLVVAASDQESEPTEVANYRTLKKKLEELDPDQKDWRLGDVEYICGMDNGLVHYLVVKEDSEISEINEIREIEDHPQYAIDESVEEEVWEEQGRVDWEDSDKDDFLKEVAKHYNFDPDWVEENEELNSSLFSLWLYYRRYDGLCRGNLIYEEFFSADDFYHYEEMNEWMKNILAKYQVGI